MLTVRGGPIFIAMHNPYLHDDGSELVPCDTCMEQDKCFGDFATFLHFEFYFEIFSLLKITPRPCRDRA